MSIFFYLSRLVDTPQPNKDARSVAVTRKQDGTEYGWGTTMARSLFHIRESESQTGLAFLAILYRGDWFYLADYDFASNSAFASDSFFPPAIRRRHVDNAGIDRTRSLMPLPSTFYICAA